MEMNRPGQGEGGGGGEVCGKRAKRAVRSLFGEGLADGRQRTGQDSAMRFVLPASTFSFLAVLAAACGGNVTSSGELQPGPPAFTRRALGGRSLSISVKSVSYVRFMYASFIRSMGRLCPPS